jgi:hypothetical protein
MLLRNYGNSPQVGDRLALVAAAERSPRHAQLVGRIVRIDRRRGMIAIAFEAVADGSLRTLSGFRRR